MKNKSTALIKLTKAEINLLVQNIDFVLSLNIPIEKEWLKPYVKIKEDLKKIELQLIEGDKEQHIPNIISGAKNAVKAKKETYQQEYCENCE